MPVALGRYCGPLREPLHRGRFDVALAELWLLARYLHDGRFVRGLPGGVLDGRSHLCLGMTDPDLAAPNAPVQMERPDATHPRPGERGSDGDQFLQALFE